MADAGLSSDPRGLQKAYAKQSSRKSAGHPGGAASNDFYFAHGIKFVEVENIR